MSSQGRAVNNVVEQMEAVIEQRRRELAELEAAAALWRSLLSSAPVPVTPAPIDPPRRSEPRPPMPARTAVVADADARERILAELRRHTVPMVPRDVAARVGLSTHRFNATLAALVASGQVHRRGVRRGMRIGLPAVMAACVVDETADDTEED